MHNAWTTDPQLCIIGSRKWGFHELQPLLAPWLCQYFLAIDVMHWIYLQILSLCLKASLQGTSEESEKAPAWPATSIQAAISAKNHQYKHPIVNCSCSEFQLGCSNRFDEVALVFTLWCIVVSKLSPWLSLSSHTNRVSPDPGKIFVLHIFDNA